MTNKNDYIFGLRAIIEAIEAGRDLDRVLLRTDAGGDLAKELLQLLRERDIPVQRVPLERLNRITRKNHQGAIAMLSAVSYAPLQEVIDRVYEQGRQPFFVVLDGVTDVRNFGAIARTASCAGVDAIVIPERGGAAVNQDAVKTSAGALFTLPVCRAKSVESAVRTLKDNGITVFGATEKASKLYTEESYDRPLAIVMGAEDKGISPEVLRQCDALVKIPLTGPIESLNVSVAAGIIMFRAVADRH